MRRALPAGGVSAPVRKQDTTLNHSQRMDDAQRSLFDAAKVQLGAGFH
ncbi:hypothetical protein GA0061084_2463 [Arthrobacter sp. NIO-1057]|nr:hypothetical protein GA0061084_2463 [Arthrobacter sp. NIO-1057]